MVVDSNEGSFFLAFVPTGNLAVSFYVCLTVSFLFFPSLASDERVDKHGSIREALAGWRLKVSR